MIEAGKLRKRITFQTRDIATDSTGAQVITWTDAFTSWAQFKALSGRELFSAQAINAEVTHEITVRYRGEFADPKVTAAMRALYKSRIFDIHACMNVDERNREITLLVAEGLTDG